MALIPEKISAFYKWVNVIHRGMTGEKKGIAVMKVKQRGYDRSTAVIDSHTKWIWQ